jgi:hypothetical protein
LFNEKGNASAGMMWLGQFVVVSYVAGSFINGIKNTQSKACLGRIIV